ncbi:MAG: leucine-rich repeat domain-containing protein [Verrucomicrobiota bacterium]
MPSASEGLTIARARIAREQERRSGLLDLGDLGLTEWPNELWDLAHLTCLNLGVGWTDENHGFHPAEPGIAYAPNALPPTAAQPAWARLPHLHTLSLAGPRGDGSPWDDLTGLENLTQLRVLDLSWTSVADLAPLARLTSLQVLDASYTFTSSLAPLARLTALRHLDLSYTHVADLSPLQAHTALQTLLCYHTPVASIAPLASLPALQKLDLTQTQVTSLDPLAQLPSLQTLHCAWTPVESIPASLVGLPTLQTLILHETALSNIPPAALSPDNATNCLDHLRAYLNQ